MQGLYAITPTFDQIPSDAWLLHQSRALLEAGVSYLQMRDKSADQTRRLRMAEALRQLCEDLGAKLIINDDLELAETSGAHGLHLGQGDGCVRQARARLGAKAIIGRTCHDSLSLAQAASDDGASYLAFGRFFPSSTKPDARPANLNLLGQAGARFKLPLVAIGGVNPDNAGQLIRAGAHALALCQALYGAADAGQATHAFQHVFQQSI